MRKLRRADELAAEGKTGEEVAAELGVSAATLYNWRRAYGGMDEASPGELQCGNRESANSGVVGVANGVEESSNRHDEDLFPGPAADRFDQLTGCHRKCNGRKRLSGSS